MLKTTGNDSNITQLLSSNVNLKELIIKESTDTFERIRAFNKSCGNSRRIPSLPTIRNGIIDDLIWNIMLKLCNNYDINDVSSILSFLTNQNIIEPDRITHRFFDDLPCILSGVYINGIKTGNFLIYHTLKDFFQNDTLPLLFLNDPLCVAIHANDLDLIEHLMGQGIVLNHQFDEDRALIQFVNGLLTKDRLLDLIQDETEYSIQNARDLLKSELK